MMVAMGFLLKKIISALLLPLPISLIVSLLGLYLLWFSHYLRLGKVLVSFGVIILIIFSISLVSNALLRGLESQYQPLTNIPNKVDTIVVLGGGVRGYKNMPANTRLSSASMARLVEAVRLYTRIPNATLILSGGRVFGSPAEADVLDNTAVMLGIQQSHIKMEKGSKDTYQEAINLKPMLSNKPFILVTSATHMPRAMALFKKQGMHPIAAPTQFLTKQNQFTAGYYLPNSVGLIHSDIAIHEYLGMLWAKIRGFV